MSSRSDLQEFIANLMNKIAELEGDNFDPYGEGQDMIDDAERYVNNAMCEAWDEGVDWGRKNEVTN